MLKSASLAFMTLSISGCGGSDLVVRSTSDADIKIHSVNLEYSERAQGISPSVASYLRSKMDESFFSRDPAFGRGGDLTVRYWISRSERGTSVSRVLLGSKTVLEAEIIDRQGSVVGRVSSQEDMNLLPGTFRLGIDRAVAQIREYIVQRFQR